MPTRNSKRWGAALVAAIVLGAGLVLAGEAGARAPADCFEEQPHVDVGIVLDESGSMSGDKIDAAKDGAQELTANLDGGQHSGLVSFDSSAYLRKEVGPNHDATSTAISNLTAGGSTATGDAIDLSHDDILASGLDDGRDVMVVLADGKTNTGSDPVAQAEEAKDAGIEIFTIAFGDGADEQELRTIASEPTTEHFYDASTDDIEQVFLNIAGNVTDRNDTQPPTVGAQVPQEGHLYVDGVDQGPNTSLKEDRATLVGSTPFEIVADDNCYLETVRAEVPGTNFTHEENATQFTTGAFDADAVAPGDYTLDLEAIDWVGLQTRDDVGLHIPALEAETRVLGLWAGTPSPENSEYRTEGLHFLEEAEADQRTALVEQPGLVRAEGVEEAGSLSIDGTVRATGGEIRIAELELFDGLVEIEALTHRANASVDLATAETTVDATRGVGSVVVDGEEVAVNDSSGPVEVDLPGDGFLRLFERETAETPVYASYHSTLVHAHAPDRYGGGEVIVGDILLEPGGGGEATPQDRAIAEQDDADSGRDAGDETGDPVEISTGVYDGLFTPSDTVDRYALEAEHGEKIKVNLEPSSKVHAQGGTVQVVSDSAAAGPPSVTPEFPLTRVQIFDPLGTLRAETIFNGGSFAPQSAEINADLNGTWTVAVERMDAFRDSRTDPAYAHYTFDLTVTPHPLLPQTDALSGSDAPASCQEPDAEIPAIRDGQWPGVLKHRDFDDVYRFQADLGDLVTATLKPGETADGVAMDLYLYDEDCQVLQKSSLGGERRLKGIPEATVQLPSDYSGTYYLRIERVNGVGNHHVTLSVRDPMPGLPTNDAGTGQDAPSDPAQATQPPPVVFQGTIEDGDDGDAYALPFDAGDRAWVTVETSAVSRFDLTLLDPNGTEVPGFQPKPSTYVWDFTPDQAGEHVLLVEPTAVGGGDYTVTWGQAPTSLLDPLPVQSSGLPGASTSP